jgi:serine/threonine protein kinase
MRLQTLAKGFDARAVGTLLDWPDGELVGDWRVAGRVGRGGTAEVWHAVSSDGLEAALKVPRREWRHVAAAHALLRSEYELLSSVASAHLVRPYEVVAGGRDVALVLEYLPHGDLVPLLGAPPRLWLRALRTVVAALGDLERRGLAHGDLKARNVLFAADGSARLADLTSARPLDGPAAVTTAAYGLPEVRHRRAREADCFALAVLLFELVTGRLPYGPAGAAANGAALALAPPPADPLAARLLSGATAALAAEGRVEGLSYFCNVIESVRTVDG